MFQDLAGIVLDTTWSPVWWTSDWVDLLQSKCVWDLMTVGHTFNENGTKSQDKHFEQDDYFKQVASSVLVFSLELAWLCSFLP